MSPSPLRVIALCCIIVGAFFLAKSINVKTPKYMLHELLRFKVNRGRFFRNHIGQKLDSVIGFLFLVVGAGLQIYLEIHALAERETVAGEQGHLSSLTNWWVVVGVTLAIMAFTAWVLSRVTRYFSGKIFVELVRFMVETHEYPLESDENLVLELGKIMRVERLDDDTVESYARRVRAKMKVEGGGPAPKADRRLAY